MPIVIEELLIKARVAESESTPASKNTSSNPSHNEDASIKQINKAVREIMDLLKRKNER